MLSLIVPTFNERENVRKLVPALFSMLKKEKIPAELIIVDDNSPDRTAQTAKILAKKYSITLIVRKQKMGLASAVLEGLRHATSPYIGIMDADLSHPIKKIPEAFRLMKNKGHDLVVCSRYLAGGGMEGWPLKRKIVSRGATLLAQPLTNFSDPVSGFVFFKKSVIKQPLNPKGFKIGLEIMVKASSVNPIEIPYVFTNRKKGKSKLNLHEIGNFVVQLAGLYAYHLTRRPA